jgi:acyl dehydratase
VARFARALGADPGDGVPPTYAAVYALGTTFPQLLGDEEAALHVANLLHGEQEFEWERPPEVGEVVAAGGRVAADVERRGMRFLTLETDVTSADRLVCRSRALFVIRGDVRPPPSLGRDGGGTPSPSPARPGRVGEGALSELTVTFTREQIVAYAEASGDHNPIHLDDELARSVGLPGVIAHGMLQMGLLARVAAEAAGGPARLRRLACRFGSMVQPGDTVVFRAEPRDGRIQLTAVDQRGRAVLTKASADVR